MTFASLASRLSDTIVGTLVPATLALARAGGGATDAVLPELLDLLTRARRDRLPVVAHYVLTVVAAVLVLRGADEAASTVLAAAGTELELPFRSPGHYALYRHYGQLLRRRLGDAVAQRCRDAGARLSLEAAADLAREVAGVAATASRARR